MDDLIPLFVKIGLSEQKAKDTAKNKKLAPKLETVINVANVGDGCDKDVGILLYTLAAGASKTSAEHLSFITKKIMDGDLKTVDQISGNGFNPEEFDAATGVGIVVTPEQITLAIAEFIAANKENIVANRYKTLGPTLSTTRKIEALRWADGGAVKNEVEAQYLALLGPKDERDAPQKKKKEPKPAADAPSSKAAEPERKVDLTKIFFEGELGKLHKAGENPQIKPELMEEHLKATGGKVVTRFPPEPNGYLHIGHAKAINVNFGYAKAHNGITYLRYDDTNPEAEEEKYFTSILETVRWLGFEPYKITYSSDYFQELFDLAVKLIKKGLAYTCQCTGEEINACRGGKDHGERRACAHRDRPIEETLDQFYKMKEGRYKESEVTLRMKMDLENGNPQFWDLIAYRVLYTPHFRTHDQWCIYPTYDFTHCLVDSFENITHSLCTTEFRQSRESYYWLVDAVEIYKPVQWEYGRLNVTGTIMSKRKILKMVNNNYVSDWDDPRLYTLVGIRRRGVPPEAINNFVLELGVTTAQSTINVSRFDTKTREYLDKTVPRLMAIADPIRVVLTNVDDDFEEQATIPNKPRDPAMGEHTVPFTKVLYIDRSDFREQDTKGYYRLAPGKSVGLLHAKYPIRYVGHKKDDSGKITEIECIYENDGTATKPKTYIHWIADSPKHHSPVQLDELRIYERLFMHDSPETVEGGYLNDINSHSLEIVRGAIAEVGLYDHIADWVRKTGGKDKESMRWQFTRTGYFCLDKDTELDAELIKSGQVKEGLKRIIVNRTVSLKEDADKN
ncbi:hypothetical protein [Parasitella parasitica]|uniref:glutamine--tRNA ligase n=1 Tax=Parasitella parasitica TaxID=35722 RepID=A0A0B7NEH1_9FUNG|nr:hypothetical protein [Parasitella parasitica]